jgi:hypothetical protein
VMPCASPVSHLRQAEASCTEAVRTTSRAQTGACNDMVASAAIASTARGCFASTCAIITCSGGGRPGGRRRESLWILWAQGPATSTCSFHFFASIQYFSPHQNLHTSLFATSSVSMCASGHCAPQPRSNYATVWGDYDMRMFRGSRSWSQEGIVHRSYVLSVCRKFCFLCRALGRFTPTCGTTGALAAPQRCESTKDCATCIGEISQQRHQRTRKAWESIALNIQDHERAHHSNRGSQEQTKTRVRNKPKPEFGPFRDPDSGWPPNSRPELYTV